MGFSITQQKYNDYFIFRANTLVNNLFNAITDSANWQDELETVLNHSSMFVGGAAAALTIATLTAPVTAGLSLAVAGTVLGAVEASIVIMQLSEGGYRFIAKPEEGCSAESIMTPEI